MNVDVDSTVMVYRSVVCEIVDYIKDMYVLMQREFISVQANSFNQSYCIVYDRNGSEHRCQKNEQDIEHLVSFVPGSRADKSGRDILLSTD